jgi:tetratricopeptide (TPR) repeat protein
MPMQPNATLPPAEDRLPEARALNMQAIERFSRGDRAGALADFQRAVELKADYAEAWNNSGLVRQMLGQYPAALADFDQALAARPDYAEALTNRALLLQALKEPAAALADLDRALACAEGKFAASVLHNRGTLKQQLGDLPGALADFDQALAIDPEHPSTHVNRGQARKEAGDLEGALADLNTALAKVPAEHSAPVLHKRGGVRVLMNDFAAALADYNEALALEPDNYLYYISRGNARYHLRDVRGVVDYRMAFRICAEGAIQELVRIVAEDVKERAADVLDNCTKHIRISPKDALAYARRGMTLVVLGREGEAAADLTRFQELVPDSGQYLPRLIDLARWYREQRR